MKKIKGLKWLGFPAGYKDVSKSLRQRVINPRKLGQMSRPRLVVNNRRAGWELLNGFLSTTAGQ